MTTIINMKLEIALNHHYLFSKFFSVKFQAPEITIGKTRFEKPKITDLFVYYDTSLFQMIMYSSFSERSAFVSAILLYSFRHIFMIHFYAGPSIRTRVQTSCFQIWKNCCCCFFITTSHAAVKCQAPTQTEELFSRSIKKSVSGI